MVETAIWMDLIDKHVIYRRATVFPGAWHASSQPFFAAKSSTLVSMSVAESNFDSYAELRGSLQTSCSMPPAVSIN